MKKILLSVMMIAMVAMFGYGATKAWFSDTETSNGNTFTAGTLDLNIDGANTNVVKFNLSNLRPGNQPTGKWKLKNVGSLTGYLDIHNIKVTSQENGILDMETEAGDITSETGELQNVLGMTLYWDNDCDGYYSAGDVYIYDGMTGGVAADYDTNKVLNSNAEQCVMGVFNWWSTDHDNLAQSDGFTLDMTYELGQTTAQ